METALVVAIIAAAASLASAFVAGTSARSARLSSHRALSLNHQLSVIDRDADELRSAYGTVAVKLGEKSGGTPEYIGAVLGALELLIACRAADEEVEKYAEMLQTSVARRSAGDASVSIRDVRIAYMACQNALEAKREALLRRN